MSFRFDGKTGAYSTILIKPGTGVHPTDTRQSKTAENGLVTTENMQQLLYAMGEQFLPGAPKRVGDQWEIKRVKPDPPFGTVTTNVTCKFKSLDTVGDAEIASIDLTGVIFFEASPVKPPPPPDCPRAFQPHDSSDYGDAAATRRITTGDAAPTTARYSVLVSNHDRVATRHPISTSPQTKLRRYSNPVSPSPSLNDSTPTLTSTPHSSIDGLIDPQPPVATKVC
jgi:hypothetical protein